MHSQTNSIAMIHLSKLPIWKILTYLVSLQAGKNKLIRLSRDCFYWRLSLNSGCLIGSVHCSESWRRQTESSKRLPFSERAIAWWGTKITISVAIFYLFMVKRWLNLRAYFRQRRTSYSHTIFIKTRNLVHIIAYHRLRLPIDLKGVRVVLWRVPSQRIILPLCSAY